MLRSWSFTVTSRATVGWPWRVGSVGRIGSLDTIGLSAHVYSTGRRCWAASDQFPFVGALRTVSTQASQGQSQYINIP